MPRHHDARRVSIDDRLAVLGPDQPDVHRGLPGIHHTRVDAINHAVKDLPREQTRLHICWGSGTAARHRRSVPDIVEKFCALRSAADTQGASPATRTSGASGRTTSCRRAP